MKILTKILVGIPVLSGYKHTMEAINSILNQENIELLIIDNNATPDLKELFKNYEHYANFNVKVNEHNIYVNPAWNQIMYAFLNKEEYKDCDILVIMNSDLTMQNNWADVLRQCYANNANASYMPVVVNDCVKLERMKQVNIQTVQYDYIKAGAAGIFITLSREQCELVYDVPETMRVWFGDNWIYGILRGIGHKTFIPDNLFGFHGLSQTVSKVEGIDEIIAKDKLEWYNNVEPYMNKLIEKYNERNDLSEQNSRED